MAFLASCEKRRGPRNIPRPHSSEGSMSPPRLRMSYNKLDGLHSTLPARASRALSSAEKLVMMLGAGLVIDRLNNNKLQGSLSRFDRQQKRRKKSVEEAPGRATMCRKPFKKVEQAQEKAGREAREGAAAGNKAAARRARQAQQAVRRPHDNRRRHQRL
nr:hypothetical protein CFP56_11848 [Quercus suber]